MDHKLPSETLTNERRDSFRIKDRVLMRYISVDESTALGNIVPPQFGDEPGSMLLRDLQYIEQENHHFLRSIADNHRELELYLRSINKKIELIAARLVECVDPPADAKSQIISLSEGGLAFHSSNQHGNDSHLAIQLTLLPSHISLVLFAKVINSSQNKQLDGSSSDQQQAYSTAVSFVQLKDSDRQILAKHIMQLQLLQRRRKTHEST